MIDPTLAIRLVVGVYRLSQRRIRIIGSTSWPMADGRIANGKMGRGDLQGWAIELTYSYVAMGEYYSGTYRRGFRRKKNAEAFLARLPALTLIPIRYKPERPEISALLLSDLSLFLTGL